MRPAHQHGAVARAAIPPRAGDAGRRELPEHGLPAPLPSDPSHDFQSAGLFRFFTRHVPEILRKAPNMPLWILRHVNAVTIKLIFRLPDDLGTSGSGTFAMSIEPVV